VPALFVTAELVATLLRLWMHHRTA